MGESTPFIMNAFHAHLLVNHIPIIGVIFSLITMIVGIMSKSDGIKRTALILVIIAGFGTFAAHVTGENAEEASEIRNDFTHQLVEQHEHASEPFFQVMMLTTLVSIAALIFSMRNHKLGNILTYVVTAGIIAASFLAQQAGESGGKIRHPEISSDSASQLPSSGN